MEKETLSDKSYTADLHQYVLNVEDVKQFIKEIKSFSKTYDGEKDDSWFEGHRVGVLEMFKRIDKLAGKELIE